MNYKHLFLICFISAMLGIAISPLVSAVETITDLNSNTPIPLEKLLTISGNFNDTDSNASVFCKFETKLDGIVIERLSDEQTFANGDFYSQRRITEPTYKRGSFYTIEVSCNNATADTNFTIAQRENIAHTVEEEVSFAVDKGNLETFFFVGFIILFVLFVGTVVIIWYKQGKKFGKGF